MMVTAKEIAEQVGVSISTVGRALANDPRISAETKAKIKKAAERAGYAGNLAARMVRGASSNLVGLSLPDVRNDFYAAIAQALSETCDKSGYRLVLSITGDDRELEARYIRDLAAARAAGMIIVPTANPRKDSVQLLKRLPHVQLLRRSLDLGGAWFGVDDEAGIREAGMHLIDLGHQRIAYIGGSEALSTGASRVRGYRKALAEAGLEENSVLERLGSPSTAFGADALRALMSLKRPPTAIITGSVHVSLGMVEAIEQLGIRVPADLSIIAFGDPHWSSWWRGGLTTVRLPVAQLATTCGLWFVDQLKRSDLSGEVQPHTTTTPSTLVIRNSTAAPGGDRNGPANGRNPR